MRASHVICDISDPTDHRRKNLQPRTWEGSARNVDLAYAGASWSSRQLHFECRRASANWNNRRRLKGNHFQHDNQPKSSSRLSTS